MTRVVIPYKPRPLQREIHRSLKRFNVLVCHRRFGKTVLTVNELIKKGIRNQRKEPRPRYAYIAPYLKQAKDVVWDYLVHYTAPIPGVQVFRSEPAVYLPNGARIGLYGADDPDALRGPYLDGAVLDENAQQPPSLWGEVIRPQLADYQGWAVFIGTPKGRNAFHQRYQMARQDPSWFAAIFPHSVTGILAEDEIKAMKAEMTEEEFAQELECSWEASLRGAYYGKEMRAALAEKRIVKVPHHMGVMVDTWWDLGHSDATAIWFVQHIANEIHLIDYYESRLQPLDHYVSLLQAKAMERGYVYGRHVWPHDGGNRTLGSGGKSLDEMASALHLTVSVQPRTDVQPGIHSVRQALPRCWFDEERCSEGIEALRAYRAEEDEKKSHGIVPYFKAIPRHDWASHGADAFRTGIMSGIVSGRVGAGRDRYRGHHDRRRGSAWAA